MMRAVGLAVLIACTGCDRAGIPDNQSADVEQLVTFDGATSVEPRAKSAHGERLTWVLGCRGCHGTQLQGHVWDDDPNGYGVSWASNLTRAVPTMTDAQLKRVVTAGIHPRRANLWGMPSELFQHLEAHDVDALVVYLRSLRPTGKLSPDPVLGPLALAEVKAGTVKPAATLVNELKSVQPVDLGRSHALGRYITMVGCAECHGAELKGVQGDTPDLVAAGGYSRADFERLITKGVPTGGRKLKPLMRSVATRYSQLTPHERDALYAYLKARAEHPSD